jgi:hypothetical protein
MNNKSVSDFVAAAMNAALQSEEHKSLFNTQYKFASTEDENDAKDKCSKCDKKHDECKCGDSMMADDNDAKKKKDSEDSKDSRDSSSADDQDSEELSSAAFDVAIDSLLTASAALDSVGLARGSALSLKLASLVVEAKKKDSSKDKDKEKAAKEKAKEKAAKEKEKAKRDSQAAKDKASKEKEKAKEKASKDKEKEKASKEKEKASKEKDSKKSSGNSSKK